MDEATVRRIAELAGLDPDEDEVERYAGELGEILAHAREIEDAGGSPGAAGATASGETAPPDSGTGRRRMRPDVPRSEPMDREPRELAPDWREGFFVVPSPGSIRDGGEGEADP